MKLNSEPGTLRYQILLNMQEKTTDELLEIWKRNDQEEWTKDAFEVIEDILQERLGQVPAQNPPPSDEEMDMVDEAGEEDEDADEESDSFHSQRIILGISSLADLASRLVLIVGAILIGIRILVAIQDISSSNAGLSLLYSVGASIITWGVNYIILQAISLGLLLFLDIEWNTRPTKEGVD